jgi:TetR/AcrR family transcriptional regulator, transcriptional repressor for nem operon
VKGASRLFREQGFENVNVAEVMKAAGLTHGAFYADFDWKEELQEAAVGFRLDYRKQGVCLRQQ